MSALAAAQLGISVVIFTPQKNSPASQIVKDTIIADYKDESALTTFAKKVDVISYEFENIPVKTIRFLKSLKPVYPDDGLLEISQDRISEKTFLNNNGISTARWASVKTPGDVLSTLEEWKQENCIIKTVRFGYDGKGQSLYKKNDNLDDTFRNFKGVPLIMEELIDFSCEASIIVARDQKEHIVTYGPMLNEHKNHILAITTAPANLPKKIELKALDIAEKLALATNLIGVLTVELFITKDNRVLANEIAPRTHNSGHWTIDACANSQFDQHVRTVCGLPAADTQAHSDAVMLNLIGQDIKKAHDYLERPHTCVHLYGKKEVRPGRKMGHITILKPKGQP